MRAQTMVFGLLQAALLMACDRPQRVSEELSKAVGGLSNKESAAPADADRDRAISQQETSAKVPRVTIRPRLMITTSSTVSAVSPIR